MDTLLPLLASPMLGKPLWLWLAFIGIVLALLVFDLGVLNRREHQISVRESLLLSTGYIGAGIAFGAWVWLYLGASSGMEYLTGFLIEKTLAMDNVFVIAMLFSYLSVPPAYQHRVLFWGIIGVIVLRAIMIGIGAALIAQFSWVLYVFGAFLVITGIRMLMTMNTPPDLSGNPLLRWLRSRLRVTEAPHGSRFWVRLPAPEFRGGPPSNKPGAPLVLWATPLLLALVLIEAADLLFAVDSVPAIFAITQDPFIVYTSNIFAILGLRALYFALAAIIDRFAYLKYALAGILVFVGGKIIVAEALGKIPAWISLIVTAALLAAGILYSLHRTRTPARQPSVC
jgi:tellurite resistance protein TerC